MTGERPFDGSSDLLTLDRIRYHDPGALRAKAPAVPEDLCAIVERLIAKNPEGRFASADEAAQALRAHMVRSGKLATSRELAAWLEEVRASLPRGLRERSVQGLSVDELLRMSLGSDPGSGPVQSTPSGLSLASEARPQTIVAAPTSTTPAPGSVAIATPTSPVTEVLPRTRFPMYLVALNLALIALVLFLVLRSDGDDKPVTATREADALVATNDVATATIDVVAAKDSGPDTVALVAAETAAPLPVPTTVGQRAGEALAALDESIFAPEVSITIRVHPVGALVAAAGYGSARAPRTIVVPRGTTLSLRITAPDHEPRTMEAKADEDDALTVTLKPVPRGRVQFKFFPAEGTRVIIDDKGIAVGSNVVSLELPVGKHTLVLETDDGKRVRRSFEIDEGQTTSLGTLDVGHGG